MSLGFFGGCKMRRGFLGGCKISRGFFEGWRMSIGFLGGRRIRRRRGVGCNLLVRARLCPAFPSGVEGGVGRGKAGMRAGRPAVLLAKAGWEE